MVVTEGVQVLDRLGESRAPDGEHCCGPNAAGASKPVGSESPLDGCVGTLVCPNKDRSPSLLLPKTKAANLGGVGRTPKGKPETGSREAPDVAVEEVGQRQEGTGSQPGPASPTEARVGICRADLLRMIADQGYRCALTGRQLTPETASLDHKVPLGRGGVHAIENIWIVHEDANRAKGTMTAEEFVALCREVVSYQEGALPHGKH